MQGKHITEQVRLFQDLTETGQALVLYIVAELMADGWRRERAFQVGLYRVYRMAE